MSTIVLEKFSAVFFWRKESYVVWEISESVVQDVKATIELLTARWELMNDSYLEMFMVFSWKFVDSNYTKFFCSFTL